MFGSLAKCFKIHKEHHGRIQDIVIDNFSFLADRVEKLEKKHNWTGE